MKKYLLLLLIVLNIGAVSAQDDDYKFDSLYGAFMYWIGDDVSLDNTSQVTLGNTPLLFPNNPASGERIHFVHSERSAMTFRGGCCWRRW